MEKQSLRDKIMSPSFRVGSGNYFKDRGYSDPEEARTKGFLANQISITMQERGLSQKDVALLTGLQQPDVSRITNYNLAEYSVWRLMKALAAIGYDLSIGVQPSAMEKGEIVSFRLDEANENENSCPTP